MSIYVYSILLCLLLSVGVFTALYAISFGSRELRDRVWQVERRRVHGTSWREQVRQRSEQLFKPLGELVPRSPEEMTRQQLKLVQAGIRRPDAAILFYGISAGLVIVSLLVFALSGLLAQNWLLYPVLAFFAGALLPDLWLKRQIAKRKERIGRSLSDLMDLLVICVEAGLGLDQALQRVGAEIGRVHRDIGDELQLFGAEVNAGRTRADALRHMAKRTDVADLQSLVAAVIQTERFGTGICESLRIFSENFRSKRRQRAEERAAKLPVKMLLPMMIFILPAIFVITVGPAAVIIMRELLPALAR